MHGSKRLDLHFSPCFGTGNRAAVCEIITADPRLERLDAIKDLAGRGRVVVA